MFITQILIVDDEQINVDLLGEILNQSGYNVFTAQDGCEASKLLEDYPIDLVITDIIMPEKNGFELIQEVRQNHPNVKIIAMSGGGGFVSGDYLEKALNLGAHMVFEKPLSLEKLLSSIKELINHNFSQA